MKENTMCSICEKVEQAELQITGVANCARCIESARLEYRNLLLTKPVRWWYSDAPIQKTLR